MAQLVACTDQFMTYCGVSARSLPRSQGRWIDSVFQKDNLAYIFNPTAIFSLKLCSNISLTKWFAFEGNYNILYCKVMPLFEHLWTKTSYSILCACGGSLEAKFVGKIHACFYKNSFIETASLDFVFPTTTTT